MQNRNPKPFLYSPVHPCNRKLDPLYSCKDGDDTCLHDLDNLSELVHVLAAGQEPFQHQDPKVLVHVTVQPSHHLHTHTHTHTIYNSYIVHTIEGPTLGGGVGGGVGGL